jgi:hypothetical protein
MASGSTSNQRKCRRQPSLERGSEWPLQLGFKKACQAEYDTLIKKTFGMSLIGRRTVLSFDAFGRSKSNVSICSMRKLKAPFSARGFEQIEGFDYSETFAPGVNWATVRFLLKM